MDRRRRTHRPSLGSRSCIEGSRVPCPFPHTLTPEAPSPHPHSETGSGTWQRQTWGRIERDVLRDQRCVCRQQSSALLCQRPWGSQRLELQRRPWLLQDRESGMPQGSPTQIEGAGNEVSQSFHHDGKNCLITPVPPTTKVPGRLNWGLWRGGGEGAPGWESIRLGAGGWENVDLLRPQKCPGMCPGMNYRGCQGLPALHAIPKVPSLTALRPGHQ